MFSNSCPIALTSINKETGYLIKVPAPWSLKTLVGFKKAEHDIFYYISDVALLTQVESCIISRRKGSFQAVKLSDLTSNQLATLILDTEEKLIEDRSQLKTLTKNFPWQNNCFKAPEKETVQRSAALQLAKQSMITGGSLVMIFVALECERQCYPDLISEHCLSEIEKALKICGSIGIGISFPYLSFWLLSNFSTFFSNHPPAILGNANENDDEEIAGFRPNF